MHMRLKLVTPNTC